MSFFNRFNFLTLLLSAATWAQAHAVPAWPGTITVQQPDGTEILLHLHGDEYLYWGETTDGYTLLRNADGYWSFATLQPDGRLAPSALRYSGDSSVAHSQGIVPHLAFPKQQLGELRTAAMQKMSATARPTGSTALSGGPRRSSDASLQVDNSFPTQGKHKLLVLLVDFADTQPTYSPQHIESMMNDEGYGNHGSFRDYYLSESYGSLDITTTVTHWVKVPYSKRFYGTDNVASLITDALEAIDGEIDFADFDNDHDGILDGLAVIHQGPGMEATGNAADIWSHSSTLSGVSHDGIQIRRYTIEPELLGTTGSLSTIGVICHEFGHNLGAPDFYDTDYADSGGEYCGTGCWDLLGSGAWNGDHGDAPAPINAWQKIQMGWITPTPLDASCHIGAMASAGTAPVAYRMDTTVPGEYFIIENRQQRDNSFHAATPGSGMIIYHADDRIIRNNIFWNNINASHPQGMYMVCAAATGEAGSAPSSYGNVDVPAALFGDASGHTAFSDYTTPSAKSREGRYSYKSISGITTNADGSLSFDFTLHTVPPKPEALEAHSHKGTVSLSWQTPTPTTDGERELGEPVAYNIYRNGEWLATTEDCGYTDSHPDKTSSTTYLVDAAYATGLLSPCAETSIRIPLNRIATAGATVVGEDSPAVRLTWTMPTTLTRMEDSENFGDGEYNCTTGIEYAHRFTADDLATMQGYKIRRVGFLPTLGPQEATYTLRVWESDAGGANPRIISERTVKEFGNYIWNDILLTKAVEISGQQELWVGLHCAPKNGVIHILHDLTSDGLGLGNWINIDNGGWQADGQCSGNYYLRFTLAVPNAPDAGSEITVSDVLGNPATDLRYPIGFGVYRDGTLLGYTGNTCFVDDNPGEGSHTYSITNLYKGQNESDATLIDVSVSTDAIAAAVPVPGLAVRTAPCSLTVEGDGRRLDIVDNYGRRIFSGICNGTRTLHLAPGLYIIAPQGGTPRKVVVKGS